MSTSTKLYAPKLIIVGRRYTCPSDADCIADNPPAPKFVYAQGAFDGWCESKTYCVGSDKCIDGYKKLKRGLTRREMETEKKVEWEYTADGDRVDLKAVVSE